MKQLAPNTLLQGGKYKIEKVLGQGSFGITYLAEHTALGKKVCIKEFFMKEINTRTEDGSITGLSDGSLSYNYAQKFRKEAQNLARMEHPNIVRVTDCFDENGTFYYVMDYIDGENLNDYIKKTYVDKEEAVNIIKDVAKALLYMHNEMHMLHLDLKPGNVMRRNSDGHIFLIDFGLSKHYDKAGAPETSTTIGLGTAGYAPIEQANQAKNGEFRPTIDVYALGATLYKLLTRETPPPASELVTDDELISDKLKEHNISKELASVVVSAMLPNVRKRTQTIKTFVEALQKCTTSNIAAGLYQEDDEETCILQAVDKTKEIAVESPIAQEPITSGECNDSNSFTKFFTKYATAIMIIAGLFFVYDIINILTYDDLVGSLNINFYYGFGLLNSIMELFFLYVLGLNFLHNIWYNRFTSCGIALWIALWIVYWLTYIDQDLLSLAVFITHLTRYAGLLLMIAFLIGIVLVKEAVGKVIFVLLMIYAGTELILNNLEDINRHVLSITEYVILLLAIALYFYSEKHKKNIISYE